MESIRSWILIVDERLLLLVETLKSTGSIRFYSDFYKSIDITKQNYHAIKRGDRSFTVSMIAEIVKKYKVNANWIFGNDDKMFL